MKKLIAIAVVFALVAGAVFAEVAIGGAAGFGASIIAGDSTKKGKDDPKLFTGLNAHWLSLDAKWTAEDNTAGATIKINGDLNKGKKSTDFIPKLGGEIWWKPFSFVQIKWTNIEDVGVFAGYAGAVAWDYHSNSAAGNVAALWGLSGGWNSFSGSAIKSGVGFFGGIGGGGENVLALSLTPIDGLAFNFAWDLQGSYLDSLEPTKDFFKDTVIQVRYDIGGIGSIGVGFRGFSSWADKARWPGEISAHTLGIDFSLTAIDSMQITLGGKIPLAGRYGPNWAGWDKDQQKVSIPMELGLGFLLNQWANEPFKLFARAGAYLPSKKFSGYGWDWGANTLDTSNPWNFEGITAIGLDVNPSIEVAGIRVYFDVGAAIVTQKADDTIGRKKGTDFYWHLNPYMRKGFGIGDLYLGFYLWNGKGQPDSYESLPVIYGKDVTKIVNFGVPVFFTVWF